MTRLTCESCAGFNRQHLTAQPIVADGVEVHPAQAQCRRTPPPWQIVKTTDWCLGWTPRRTPLPNEDND
jgi:hypothetical protein